MINQFKNSIRKVKDKSIAQAKLMKDIKIRYFDLGLPKAGDEKPKIKQIHDITNTESFSFFKFKLNPN